MLSGWVRYTFIEPEFTFTFIGFEWLQPLSGNGMYYYYGALALLAVMIAIGLFYRFAMVAFTLLWVGCYFMHKEGYNNHFYLILLLCAVMVFMPAHRYASADVARRPHIKSLHCDQWIYWLFIAQIGVVYFFGGIGKLYPDWLSGQVVSILFRSKSHIPVIGFLYAQRWFQLFICYGGIFFDLLITPMLLCRPTRKVAFVLCCCFHIFNAITFSIGIFPLLAVASTIFFFSPQAIQALFFPGREYYVAGDVRKERYAPAITLVLGAYLAVQVLLPLRSFLYPGNPNWTEEGHRLSWRMMLRSKRGSVVFNVRDNETGRTWAVDPATLLTARQIGKMAVSPDMVWQLAQRLKKDYAKQGYDHISIYAQSSVSLNGRPPQPLIKPDADLAATEWSWWRHREWVTREP